VKGSRAERAAVFSVLGLTVLLALALMAASLLPSAALAGRLLGAAGESRSGSVTQELLANLSARLRFVAGLLLALAAGLAVLRSPFERLLASVRADLTCRKTPGLDRRELLTLVGLTLLAVALRLLFIGQPMRYDEALSFNEFASRPLYYGLSFYPEPNNHLLNTLLVHLTYGVFGNQPWVLRVPALIGGALLVGATYALGRTLYGPRAGWFAAALAAVSSILVEYSTNSRAYTLQALAFVACLILAIEAVRRDRPSLLLLAALSAALGAFAVPTMLYGAAAIAVWLAVAVWYGRTRRFGAGELVVSALLLSLLVGLLYTPVMLISGPDKLAANRFVVPLDLSALAHDLPLSLLRTWEQWNRDVPLPIAALLAVGFLIAVVFEIRARRPPLGLLIPLVCLALVLVQRVAPFERVWLFLLPLYFAVAAGGLARFVDGRLLAGALGVILAYFTLTSGSVLRSSETGAFPDAEAVALTLQGRLATEDAVVTRLPSSLPELQYYFPRVGLPISTLVREPADAARVYVIAPLDGPDPTIPGWSNPVEVERYPNSRLLLEQDGG
jgi:hypothetical protein